MDRNSAFFLLGPGGVARLDRTKAADLLIDPDEFRAQILKAMVLVDLGLRLVVGGWGRKRFRDGLAIHFAGEADMGIVSRIIRLGAMTSRFSTTAGNGADRPWAKIAEGIELERDHGTLGFQGG